MLANKDNSVLGGFVASSLLSTGMAYLAGVPTVNSNNLRDYDSDCDHCEA